MLDRLPTELLLHTLQLAAPLDYTPSFYLQRRHLLLDCSLVSKKLCAIARPMLLEVYEIKEVQDLEVLGAVENGEKRVRKVKVVSVKNTKDWDKEYEDDDYIFLTLYELVDLTPSVVDVRLLEDVMTDLSELANLPSLRYLITGELDFKRFEY